MGVAQLTAKVHTSFIQVEVHTSFTQVEVHTSFTQVEVRILMFKKTVESWSTDYTFSLKLKEISVGFKYGVKSSYYYYLF